MNFEKELASALGEAVIRMPDDIVIALKKAFEIEKSGLARMHLRAIIDNIKLADKENLPICEDTGIQTIFIDAGYDFPYLAELVKAIPKAVETATREGPLRPNTVNPFTGKNSGDNLGPNAPAITINMVEGDSATVHLLPKGGGSEQMSRLWMLNPADGIEGLKKQVLKRVQEAGGRPCPPTIIGIGIGGSADMCMKLAKKSLLRPLDQQNPNADAARLEKELLAAINQLEIGPMGMGGKTTSLGVHVEFAPRHPATFPVGLVMQCWGNRHVILKIDKDGGIKNV